MLVLRVLPLRSHSLFEQVVIRLQSEIGDRGDIVLVSWSAFTSVYQARAAVLGKPT